MIRRLFVDVEATGDGYDPNHTILQICARYYENERFVEEYYKSYSPRENTVYAHEAIMNKAERHKEMGYISAEEDIPNFVDWLNRMLKGYTAFFIGYNCSWDFRHVKGWLKKGGVNKKYFFDPCICVMMLCSQRFDYMMSLGKAAEKFGLELDVTKLHDAKYDVIITSKLYGELIKKLKG